MHGYSPPDSIAKHIGNNMRLKLPNNECAKKEKITKWKPFDGKIWSLGKNWLQNLENIFSPSLYDEQVIFPRYQSRQQCELSHQQKGCEPRSGRHARGVITAVPRDVRS